MAGHNPSRRNFIGATAGGAAAAISAVSDPIPAPAQAAGIRPGDLPDLAIKEVKVYVLKPEETKAPNGSTMHRVEQYASVVTASGIEGNYVLTNRYSHSNWSNLGWLAYAKRTLVGKNVLDMAEFTNQFHSPVRQLSYASAMDNCLWDILGKAVNLPVYRLLGAYRETGARLRQFAASAHGG